MTEESQPAEPLAVHVSSRLRAKLASMAQEEGVGIEALVQELLAESVTLRAWEILERKSAMRAQRGPAPAGNHRPPASHGNRGNQGNHGNHGGPKRNPPNNAWMEDKAAFLEYVRNQERGRR